MIIPKVDDLKYSEYVLKLKDEDKIEDILQRYYSPSAISRWKLINILLNIIIASLVFYFFKFNFIAWAVSFMVFDILSAFIDYFFVFIIPKLKFDIFGFKGVQKCIEIIDNDIELVEDNLRSNSPCGKYCDKLRDYWCSDDSECYMYLHYRWLTSVKRRLDRYNKKKLEEIKQVEIKAEEAKKVSELDKKYIETLEFYKSIGVKIVKYSDTIDSDTLKKMETTINDLVKLLTEKTVGFKLIPNSLNIYFTEFLRVIEKVATLDEKSAKSYKGKLLKIADALSEDVSELNERIKTFEINDIDVSLKVLYDELVDEENKVGEE